MARELKVKRYDIALIQEPYLYKGEVKGLGGTGGMFSYRDLTAVKIQREGDLRGVIVASAYLPYEKADPVSRQMQDLIQHGNQEDLETIIGCDANAHHVVWGSSNNNARGERLLDFLVSSETHVINKGNKPTFFNARRAEVIDLTLACKKAVRKITNWYNAPIRKDAIKRRNPRNTNWEDFKRDLRTELSEPKCKLNSVLEIEFDADRITNALKTAWRDNCPEREAGSKKLPWWTKEIALLRRETRKAFNIARARNDFTEYRRALTEYSKAVRKAKRKAWRDHCEMINSVPEGMRLTKAMSTTKANPLTTVWSERGGYTEAGKDTLKTMIATHFPESQVLNDDQDPISVEEQNRTTNKLDWVTAKRVVDETKELLLLTTGYHYLYAGG
ncbi:uncharacterized protein LOC135077339 [Ostrinia nubilalis]|uniref:uncharacterized protein LOC135077339 n=1 Tax=Ostrinia nubilalis TaxID=29057 RepID=UPI0030822971